MPQLADLQRDLAAALTRGDRGARGPEGMDRETLDRARRGLESKRRRAVAHLLPRLRAVLAGGWEERFRRHASGYAPAGLLPAVDDAWELAAHLARDPEPAVAVAARDDLAILRLRWVRQEPGTGRLRERRGPLIVRLRTPRPLLLVKLPGAPGRVWHLADPLDRLWKSGDTFPLRGEM
jgi:hypothetical protein